MSKDNKGKSTGKAVNSKQKKKTSGKSGKEAIFKEVSNNLSDTEYNKNQEKKKKKKKKHKVLKIILTVFLLAFLIFTGLFLKRWSENGWTFGGLIATILGHDANTLANLPRVNILVVGQSQNLTDTILVCTYDPKIQDVSMLSIPRDTFVGRNKNYATGNDKINALYQTDPEKLVAAVNDLTGLELKYYIKVDTKGLRDLVDSIGGIDFNVPIDMDYDDESQDLHIHLKAGKQHLNGDKAEQVVRFRHNNDGSSYPTEYGDQDLGRMKTQRAFIAEVIKQVVKVENFNKVDDYIRIANQNVETNFNLWSLKDYAPYAIDFDSNNIKSAALPGAPVMYNSLWFYECNRKETQELVNEMFKKGVNEVQSKNSEIKVSILNGTNDDSKLEKMKNLLKENGYTISSTGTTTTAQTTAIINRTQQSEAVATDLKNTIGVGVISTAGASSNGVDFTIIIGSDY